MHHNRVVLVNPCERCNQSMLEICLDSRIAHKVPEKVNVFLMKLNRFLNFLVKIENPNGIVSFFLDKIELN